ncbi:MAG: hypothetical protein DRQ51_04360 [Gammaproteobacteria bacterium]|nr:MAG: hypothetical protein DRQ51_04360 [Gammaproteobacteria bacterium]
MDYKFKIQNKSKKQIFIKYAFIIILSTAVGVCIFKQTDNNKNNDYNEVFLTQKIKNIQKINNKLVNANAKFETSSAIDKKISEKLQQKLEQKEKDMVGIQNELTFYKKLMDTSQKNKNQIFVKSFIFKKISDKTYRYSLFLAKTYDGSFAKGVIEFKVDGLKNNKKTLLNNKLLDISNKKFNFKVIQEIEGNLYIPNNFYPNSLQVKINSTNSRYKDIINDYTWTEILNKKKE